MMKAIWLGLVLVAASVIAYGQETTTDFASLLRQFDYDRNAQAYASQLQAHQTIPSVL